MRAVLLVAFLLGSGTANAQLSPLVVPETVSEQQPVNFFLSWDADRAVDGYYVDLPDDWSLEAVQVAEVVARSPLPVSLASRARAPGSAYRVAVEDLAKGNYETILKVQIGDRLGRVDWQVTPFVRQEGADSLLARDQFSGSVNVGGAFLFEEQFAALFDARVSERPALEVDGSPFEVALNESFTVEFWMKTVQINEVLVSTWDGREQTTYPFEMMVDGHGYLNCYRRSDGLHHSLMSSRPLADGMWHHVAMSHDDGDGWTRLIVDGQTIDSLHVSSQSVGEPLSPVTLGGRPDPPYRSSDDSRESVTYTGAMDEFRFWASARPASAIRQSMHRQMMSDREGLVRLGFDESDLDRRLTDDGSGLSLVRSGLSLFDPIERLSADRRAGGIKVSWEAIPTYSEAFVVERSPDGHYFEEVSRVPAGSADPDEARRSRQYSVTDPTMHEGVVYYRVRQVVGDDERQPTTKTIKVGLRSPRKRTVDLVGNFPNPFNSSTVIKYELHETQDVRLEVWDMSGHRRAMLVNKTQEPGSYDVRYDAANLPSGAYVIRLETDRVTQTHSMILMK